MLMYNGYALDRYTKEQQDEILTKRVCQDDLHRRWRTYSDLYRHKQPLYPGSKITSYWIGKMKEFCISHDVDLGVVG